MATDEKSHDLADGADSGPFVWWRAATRLAAPVPDWLHRNRGWVVVMRLCRQRRCGRSALCDMRYAMCDGVACAGESSG